MKTSVTWLKRYVDISWPTAELTRRLTLAGLEVEGVHAPKAIPDGVVIAEILSRSPHPNADKLSVCSVNAGGDAPLQIVCGAPNCDAGKRIPLATIGTDFGEGFKIKKAKLRGVESNGMLCSAKELGLPEDGVDGLLILPADAPLGMALSAYLGGDTVIDWEITPNRPDWASHIGIAREIAAVSDNRAQFRLPAVTLSPKAGTAIQDHVKVTVQAPDLCPRYTARLIRNVTVAPSPAWLQQALESVGLRPINNVVDITNFVLHECGQPLHAFDFSLIQGQQIIVRRANPGESITTLDGKAHALTPENLLIADANRGVALAGIMGGADSMILDSTTTVLLESAMFLPANVRATARKLGLSTDSSYRFERGVSWDIVDYASARATALICELAGGELVDGVLDVSIPRPAAKVISCRCARVNQLLGLNLSAATIADCFTRLGITVIAATDERLDVRCPDHRLDLHSEIDLVEEVVRIYGIDNIPENRPIARLGGPQAADKFYPIEAIRNQLLGLGLDETITYSMLSEADAVRATGIKPEELIILGNPISSETAAMRPSLLPFLLNTVAHNVAHNNPDLGLFEIGRVMVRSAQFPEERLQVGIVLTGRVHPERYGAERAVACDFFDLKGLVESWMAARNLKNVNFQPATHPAFIPGRCAELLLGGKPAGVLGEVSAELTAGMRLKTPLYIALVEVDALHAAKAPAATYQPLPQFPATSRDISLVATDTISARQIADVIGEAACPWLEKVELFDVFADAKSLGAGNRSMAFSLTYRDRSRTLTDTEVNHAHDQIKATLTRQLQVQFR